MGFEDQFSGKVVLVTGAARGIGAACARLFAERGARIALADIDETGVEARAEELVADGHQARAYRLDVTREEEWRGLLDRITGDSGPLNMLINNAGIAVRENIVDLSDASLDRLIGINVRGVMLGMKWALARMGQGDAILNLSSAAAFASTPGYAAYCASKAAVDRLTRVAAQEGGPRGIRVNCLYPGNVDTDMITGIATDLAALGFGESLAAVRDMMAAGCALGRLATTLDVARAAAFLCSEEASFITGAGLAVDGGSKGL